MGKKCDEIFPLGQCHRIESTISIINGDLSVSDTGIEKNSEISQQASNL